MTKTQATTITILLVTVLLVGGVVVWNNTQNDNTENTATTSSSTSQQSSASGKSTSQNSEKSGEYVAGEYTATGNYESPDGPQKIVIKLTIGSDGTITKTSATSGANGRESSEYQGRFIGGYESKVVGKDIDTLSLDSVSGSSLTPQGFNDALEKIRQEAQV